MKTGENGLGNVLCRAQSANALHRRAQILWKYEGKVSGVSAEVRTRLASEAQERTARREADTLAQHERTAAIAGGRFFDQATRYRSPRPAASRWAAMKGPPSI